MFTVSAMELIIGGNIWIFHFDPLATSVEEFLFPKKYIYDGYFSNNNEEYMSLIDIETDEVIKHYASRDYSVFSTGYYIIAPSIHKIFHKLKKIANAKLADKSYGYKASEYLKYIGNEKPEWVI